MTGSTVVKDSHSRIVINQIGYYANSPKAGFLVNGMDPENPVELVNAKTKKTVLIPELGSSYQDKDSKDIIQNINFTAVKEDGTYYLQYGKVKSYPFQISKNVYQSPWKKLLRSYYLQRCGVAINDKSTGVQHSVCHLNDGLIAHQDKFNPQGKLIDGKGGWHDAGDYGKYITPTAVTIGRLLSLYEQYPKLFTDKQLSIPESGNGIPDVLDEVKIGLDWMLKMQRQDGAVYRKLSGKKWPGEILPNEDNQPRFVYGVSTSDTATFAAAMAMAGRIYKPYNQKLAQQYLKAAETAWNYLQTEPVMKVNWVEGDDSGSGNYLANAIDTEETLKTDKDDRIWAASELYITTGKSNFQKYLVETIPSFDYGLFEWKDPSPLGMTDYLFQKRQPSSEALKNQIKEKLLKRANTLLKRVQTSPYRMANQRFIWASNKMTAEEGITLFYAYKLTGNQAYLQAAVDQVDYLLGRNHFNKSFVSGVGTNFVQNVHHRIARAKKIVIPGLLVGGANTLAQDNIAPKGKGALSYVDDERSYATNEYAIDYNASLIGLMGLLMGGGLN
ncbi:MAG: glycoside hydrolase family 9 protein [Nostocaceae cyanobacterium]|nr:glycoside hydrolase family 9 protein [Nostocaceae cyanobacterium]